jgi:hypothetical protein
LHWSVVVQTLLSVQDVPEIGLAWHASAASLHTPVLHWSVNAEQFLTLPPVQTPA